MKRFRNIAMLVRNQRAKKMISQTTLSDKLGYKNGQLISNVERGLCSLPEGKINETSKILDVDSIDIVEAMVSDKRSHLMGLISV